jgi:hypothetical protein
MNQLKDLKIFKIKEINHKVKLKKVNQKNLKMMMKTMMTHLKKKNFSLKYKMLAQYNISPS